MSDVYWNINRYSIETNDCYCRIHGRISEPQPESCVKDKSYIYKTCPSSPIPFRVHYRSPLISSIPPPSLSLRPAKQRYTGCCSALSSSLKISQKSDSYSALECSERSFEKVSGNCVKNILQWVSKVGKETSNMMDNLSNWRGEDHHVVMLGLDSVGKTTFLYRLKFDQYVNTVSTIGFNCEKIRGTLGRSRGLIFLVWDVGGQEKIRPLWKPYTRATDGIIFVVDSTDSEDRIEEAKLELHRIMSTSDNIGIPLLVIANKQDLPASRSTTELIIILELSKVKTSYWHIEPCCAVTGEGLDVAMDVLHELISKRKKVLKRLRNKTR